MQLTQSILRNSRTHRDKIATICGIRKRTWLEFVERVSRLSGSMRDLGVGRGDRVAILSLNSDRYLEVCFASWWLGAVIVPMNIRWSASESAYSLNDSTPKILFVDHQFSPSVSEIIQQTEIACDVVYLGDDRPPDDMLDYEHLVASGLPIPDVAASGEDLAGIFYTGGTTGTPKGVMLPHRALWSSGLAFAGHARLDDKVRCLHAAPMFHIADFMSGMSATIAGSTQIFIPAFTPRGVIDIVAKENVTFTVLVPTMIKMLVEELDQVGSADMTSLTQVAFGASPMPKALLENALRVLPNVKWSQAYGQTELAPLITFQPSEFCTPVGENADKMTSAGRAAWCCELRIVDADGKDVEVGEIGEVLVKGPNAMLGYWNKPEETASVLIDGWIHTGDAALMDKDGFIYIKDRLKDMIITGGENVFSAEVESTLSLHPSVRECAVIGIPDERWGETVLAIVVKRDGHQVEEHELIDHCRAQIAHYKCPSRVEFKATGLPISGAGKILKRELRAPYWEGRDQQVS